MLIASSNIKDCLRWSNRKSEPLIQPNASDSECPWVSRQRIISMDSSSINFNEVMSLKITIGSDPLTTNKGGDVGLGGECDLF